MRQAIIIGIASLFIGLIAVFSLRLSNLDTPSADSPMVGQPVPAIDLAILERETARLAPELDGQARPVLINFWASWCAPCLAEHPILMQLADSGVEITGIAYRDTVEKMQTFLARHGDPFTTVYQDPNGEAMLSFGNSGVPETYVVDPQGVIQAHVRGPLGPTQIKDVILPALMGAR